MGSDDNKRPEATVLDPCLPGAAKFLTMPEFLTWVAADLKREMTLKAKVEAFVEAQVGKVGSGKRTTQGILDSVRAVKAVTAEQATGRRLSANWTQAVPVSKWEETFPGKPLPGSEYRGRASIDGQWVDVVYMLKDGAKANIYDVEDYNDDGVRKKTQLAEVRQDDSDEEETALTIAHETATQAVAARRGKTNAMSMANLASLVAAAGVSGANVCEIGDEDSDESDDQEDMVETAVAEALSFLTGPPQPKAAAKAGASGGSAKTGAGGAAKNTKAAKIGTATGGNGSSSSGRGAQTAQPAVPAAAASSGAAASPGAAARAGEPPGAAARAGELGDEGQDGASKPRRGRPMLAVTRVAQAARDHAEREFRHVKQAFADLAFDIDANMGNKSELKEFKFTLSKRIKEAESVRAQCLKLSKAFEKAPGSQDGEQGEERAWIDDAAAATAAAVRIAKASPVYVHAGFGAAVRAGGRCCLCRGPGFAFRLRHARASRAAARCACPRASARRTGDHSGAPRWYTDLD